MEIFIVSLFHYSISLYFILFYLLVDVVFLPRNAVVLCILGAWQRSVPRHSIQPELWRIIWYWYHTNWCFCVHAAYMPIAVQEMRKRTEKRHRGRLQSTNQQPLSVSVSILTVQLIRKGLECALSSNKTIQRRVSWGCHVKTLHCTYQKKKTYCAQRHPSCILHEVPSDGYINASRRWSKMV